MPEAADHSKRTRVLVLGGGFAGLGCARKLAKRTDVDLELVDQNNYHQFQPLLYQVATSQLTAGDVGFPLRRIIRHSDRTDVTTARVASIDPLSRSVTTVEGTVLESDILVVAAGSQPNFFGTTGAEEHAYPLYSLAHALRLRARILQLFEEADRDPRLIEKGALEFVIVGGGPTGVEVAGALSDLIHYTLASEYSDVIMQAATVHLVDHGDALLAAFPDKAHAYAKDVLERNSVRLHMGTAVDRVAADHVELSDGSSIPTRCVIWAGGLQAAPIVADSGLPIGRGGRVDVNPDMTVAGFPGMYVVGDIANVPGPDDRMLPQLGSVALQSGQWAARNIEADLDGHDRKPFKYHDKGTMAMIGRNAAVADMGPIELHGTPAFAAWLGVHAALMTGVRNRIDAFISWGWNYFGMSGGPQVLDRSDLARIDWDDDDEDGG
jgi:NADH dehydrogenase